MTPIIPISEKISDVVERDVSPTAHHDVCLAWRLPQAHVAADHSYKLFPTFGSNQISQSNDRIRVLVQSEDAY